jgi:hypothetical protein
MTVVRADLYFTRIVEQIQYNFADYIIPSGPVDGYNQIFTLPNTPFPGQNLEIYYNGILQNEGVDYTEFQGTITYNFIPSVDSSQFAFFTW